MITMSHELYVTSPYYYTRRRLFASLSSSFFVFLRLSSSFSHFIPIPITLVPKVIEFTLLIIVVVLLLLLLLLLLSPFFFAVLAINILYHPNFYCFFFCLFYRSCCCWFDGFFVPNKTWYKNKLSLIWRRLFWEIGSRSPPPNWNSFQPCLLSPLPSISSFQHSKWHTLHQGRWVNKMNCVAGVRYNSKQSREKHMKCVLDNLERENKNQADSSANRFLSTPSNLFSMNERFV